MLCVLQINTFYSKTHAAVHLNTNLQFL
jgi:hypothetical protein